MLAYTAVDILCVHDYQLEDMENNVSQTLYKHCYTIIIDVT